jgi:hypothetical protein
MTAVTLALPGVTLEPTCSERNYLEEAFDEVVATVNEFGANNNFDSIKIMILGGCQWRKINSALML